MTPLRSLEIAAYLILAAGLWLLVTWGAGAGHLLWPAAVVAAVLAAACWRAGDRWWRVAVMCSVGLACAFAVDGSLLKIRLVGYAGADPGTPVPTPWGLSLWMLCAATLALPARRMLSSPVLAGILGGIGGPLACQAGRALGAIDTNRTGLIVLGIFCALAAPVLVLVANRLLPLPAPGPAPGRRPQRP